MLQSFEGTVLHTYRDQVNIETVCTGHVVQPDDATWIEDGVTRAECAEVLRQDVLRYSTCVNRFVTVDLTQPQHDALTSLCFNIGETAFWKSTLVRVLNRGDYVSAATHFADWRFAGGRPILLARRLQEAARFASGIVVEDAHLQAAMEISARDAIASVIDPMGSTGA